jgi:hypothetical protein
VCPPNPQLLIQDFAQFNDVVANKYHAGIDLAVPSQTDVFAAGSGTVRRLDMDPARFSGDNHGMGNVVIIDHGVARTSSGQFTLYAHLESIQVVDGSTVVQGQQIGLSGSTGNVTGPHLHFEVKDANVLASQNDGGPPYYWGYTGVSSVGANTSYHPENNGFRDPLLSLHPTATIPGTALVQVTHDGHGDTLRSGPDDYPPPPDSPLFPNLGTTVERQVFVALARSDPTSTCDSGWYRIHLPGGNYFQDRGAASNPDAWICRGHGNEVRVEAAYIFVESVGGSATVSTPPSDLYNVQVSAQGLDSNLGRIRTATGFEPVISDIAMSPSGELWGVSFDKLYQIDLPTAQATEICCLNVSNTNALAFDASGSLFSATDTGFLYRVDIQNAQATVIGSFGSGFISWGDLAFSPSGELFASARDANGQGFLVTVDPNSGLATPINPGTPIGVDNVWGMAFVGIELFGVASAGNGTGSLISLDTNQGTALLVRSLAFSPGGAAMRSPLTRAGGSND